MKHSIVMKFLAILFAACTLVAAVGSIGCMIVLEENNLYSQDLDTYLSEYVVMEAEAVAYKIAYRYVLTNLSNCPTELLMELGYWYALEESFTWSELDKDQWGYVLYDENDTVIESAPEELEEPYIFSFPIRVSYPVQVNAKDVDGGSVVSFNGQSVTIQNLPSPMYTVTISLTPGALTSYKGLSMTLLQMVYDMRYIFVAVLAASLLVFAVCMVYLCCAAGKTTRKGPVNPGGLNRLPLDVYAFVAVAGCLGASICVVRILDSMLHYSGNRFSLAAFAFAGVLLAAGATVGVGFVFAVAAQVKMKGLYWWHRSVTGWVIGKIWFGAKLFIRTAKRMLELMPLIWQYVLIGGIMGLSVILGTIVWVATRSMLLLIVIVFGCIAVVCYGAYCTALILDGSEQMAKGNLNMKISTKYLTGFYSKCADNLNALADVATTSAKKQMQSERMKTELITNVSHDIKTPLTSIINYVDLLQKPHTQQEQEQYLEVLGRQSNRMKKLIEDLMEMSKAASGNTTVEITKVDAAEAINQALGEFSDKLAEAGVIPIFRQPEETTIMAADGRLTWRVLSNLLGNIVKYALPGTRVYIDLMKLDNQVVISIKNISKEPLNISAEELTERFVRGDASRNSEGSGLGLNIAQSLMELQKGQLLLLVDGDLFKVTLIFPCE